MGFCSWAGVLPWRTDAALGSSEAARQRETVIWINALMFVHLPADETGEGPQGAPQAGERAGDPAAHPAATRQAR
eukprot:6555587-Prymnesium_polylepis.1